MTETPTDRKTVEWLAWVEEALANRTRRRSGHYDDIRHHEDVAATLRALADERDAAAARAEKAEAKIEQTKAFCRRITEIDEGLEEFDDYSKGIHLGYRKVLSMLSDEEKEKE
jgi:hypothetical protein